MCEQYRNNGKKLPGVLSAAVNFASENLVLTYDPSVITLEEIAAAVEAAGYGLVISEEEKRNNARRPPLGTTSRFATESLWHGFLPYPS